MSGPRLALSLTIVACLVGALASAQDGFQKAVPKRKQVAGFGKATAAAPDPVIRWTGMEAPNEPAKLPPAEPVGTTESHVSASVPTTTVAPVVAPTPAPRRNINFVAPQPIMGMNVGAGCTPSQCGEGSSCAAEPCVSQVPNCSCETCQTCAPNQRTQNRQRQPRMLQQRRQLRQARQARLAARQRTAKHKRRQRWWPWLATNDMPAPQECGCADCTGVAVSQQAGVLVAPVQVTPEQSPIDRHQFTVLSEMNESEAPVTKRGIPFMNLNRDDKAESLPKRIQRVAQRVTKAANRQVRRASARFESHRSDNDVVPEDFGEWTSGSK